MKILFLCQAEVNKLEDLHTIEDEPVGKFMVPYNIENLDLKKQQYKLNKIKDKQRYYTKKLSELEKKTQTAIIRRTIIDLEVARNNNQARLNKQCVIVAMLYLQSHSKFGVTFLQ